MVVKEGLNGKWNILEVVQIFVSQRHRVNALSNHRLHLVTNLPALAPVTERTRHFRRQTDPVVDFAQ